MESATNTRNNLAKIRTWLCQGKTMEQLDSAKKENLDYEEGKNLRENQGLRMYAPVQDMQLLKKSREKTIE